MTQGSSSGSSKAKILMFENRKYNETEFVIPSQDTKGHSERFQFRIQPGHLREINEIMASKKFPFRTQGDLGRLAIKLTIDLLKSMEPMPSVLSQTDAIIELIRNEEYRLEFLAAFEMVSKAISQYISAGEQGQARKMVVMIGDKIKLMPKGYWRKKYSNELKQKFGYLLKDAGASLTDSDDRIDEDEDDE